MEPPVDEPTRLCPACNITKPFRDYYKHQRGRDGLQVYCKTCMTQKVREGRKARRERERIPVTTPVARWPSINAPRLHARQYAAMLTLQAGVCAGCSRPETVQDALGRTLPLSLYGNATGATVVRVLLCKMCTMSMSCGRDDPGILGRLASLAAGGVRQEVRVHVEE